KRRPSLTAAARDVVKGRRSGRRNGSPVEQRNGRSSDRQCGSRGRVVLPRCATSNDGVREDKELSCASNKRALVLLSLRDQPFVKTDDLLIPSEGCRQGRV